MKKWVIVLLFTTGYSVAVKGQQIPQDSIFSAEPPKPALSFGAYMELYYGFDFNMPENNSRPGFIYSHTRHNEVTLNLGFIRAFYGSDRLRANLAFAAGTYMNANYAGEPGVLRQVFEANAGVKLTPDGEFWLDVGLLPSHIGFESAIGKDNWTLTRSLLAENSPYYEAGARLTYTAPGGRWLFSGLVLNGWQRIQRVDGNSLPSFGTQVIFKPGDAVTLNSSTFIGTDKPDEARLMRLFHNFFAIIRLSGYTGLTIGLDVGAEQQVKGKQSFNTWFSYVAILRQQLSDRVALAGRYEYYQDANGVIIPAGASAGFKTHGLSVNLDMELVSNVWWRLESKGFFARGNIFRNADDKPVPTNLALTTALMVSF